jgi:hypothetical protein
MAQADFYQQDKADILITQQQLAALDAELEIVSMRWEALEEKA